MLLHVTLTKLSAIYLTVVFATQFLISRD